MPTDIDTKLSKQVSFQIKDHIVYIDANSYHELGDEHNYIDIIKGPFKEYEERLRSEYLDRLTQTIKISMSDRSHVIRVSALARWGRYEVILENGARYIMKKRISLFNKKEFYCLGYCLFILKSGSFYGNNSHEFQTIINRWFISIIRREGEILLQHSASDASSARPISDDLKNSLSWSIDIVFEMAYEFLEVLRTKGGSFEEFVAFLEAGPPSLTKGGWADSR